MLYLRDIHVGGTEILRSWPCLVTTTARPFMPTARPFMPTVGFLNYDHVSLNYYARVA